MNEEITKQLCSDYVEGWLTGDASLILDPLATNCFITESHGPTYYGTEQVKRWADEWFETGTVDNWTIDSFFLAKDAAFFEWTFTCTIDGKTDTLDGASVVQFKNQKIYHIHEYRMTEPAFDYFKS